MMYKRLISCIFCLLLVACASEKRNMGLKKSLNLYDSSLRWGEFSKAKKLRKDQGEALDYAFLKDIKVTSVEEKERNISEDGLKVDRVVEIKYYDRRVGMVKTIFDKEIWLYDTERELWSLDSEMPDFEETRE